MISWESAVCDKLEQMLSLGDKQKRSIEPWKH